MRKRIDAFGFAIDGLKDFFLNHTPAKIHFTIGIFVTLIGFYLQISTMEWLIIVLVISMVLVAEAFNTCLEYLCDKITTDFDPAIKKIKDLAAGAVLLTSIAAIIIGVIIFLPKIIC